jgi:hypothetical protein
MEFKKVLRMVLYYQNINLEKLRKTVMSEKVEKLLSPTKGIACPP